MDMSLPVSLPDCHCPYPKSTHARSAIGTYESSKVRTLAILDCIEQRQMIVMTRTVNHCLGCLRGEVEEFRARRIGNGVAPSDMRTLVVLDYIDRRQIMAMTRETSDPALGA